MSLFTAELNTATSKFPKKNKEGHIVGFGRATWTKVHITHIKSGEQFHFTVGRKKLSFTDSRDKESLTYARFKRTLIELVGESNAYQILSQLPEPEVTNFKLAI